MNLIYLYDEFMRVPAGIEGNPVYIFDDTLTEGYKLSDKIIENRYFLAKEAGAEIYRGCLLYTSPSPRDPKTSRMPSSA